MRENQKTLCDNILRYGEIIKDIYVTRGNDNIRHYIINYDGVEYTLTKYNGEWWHLYFTK